MNGRYHWDNNYIKGSKIRTKKKERERDISVKQIEFMVFGEYLGGSKYWRNIWLLFVIFSILYLLPFLRV